MRWISCLGRKYENQYRANFIWKYAEENETEGIHIRQYLYHLRNHTNG
jgi:hypothetical protein